MDRVADDFLVQRLQLVGDRRPFIDRIRTALEGGRAVGDVLPVGEIRAAHAIRHHFQKHFRFDVVLFVVRQDLLDDSGSKRFGILLLELAGDMKLGGGEQRHVGHGRAEDMPARDAQRGEEVVVFEQFWILRAGARLDVGVERDLRDIGRILFNVISQLAICLDVRLAQKAERPQHGLDGFGEFHFCRKHKSCCHSCSPEYHHALMKSRQKQTKGLRL